MASQVAHLIFGQLSYASCYSLKAQQVHWQSIFGPFEGHPGQI